MLRHQTLGDLAEYLGLTVGRLPDRRFDLVVRGSGPTGLAAAVYRDGGYDAAVRRLIDVQAVLASLTTRSRCERRQNDLA